MTQNDFIGMQALRRALVQHQDRVDLAEEYSSDEVDKFALFIGYYRDNNSMSECTVYRKQS